MGYHLSEQIKNQIELIRDEVCSAVPDELECETNLPGFWRAINMGLFNADNGWFSPASMCQVHFFIYFPAN